MIDWAGIKPVGLVSGRLLLSAIFLVAAVAKFLDRGGGRLALMGFGVPAGIAPALALALPLAELAVALALIPVSLAWFGAIGALCLLLLFVVAIGANLALGRKPDCRRFGQLHSAPVGWSTLMRNAVLACAAGCLVWQGRSDPGPSLAGLFDELATSRSVVLVSWTFGLALFASQAALLVQILKQQGRILLRLDSLDARPAASSGAAFQPQAHVAGLPVGSPAPNFRLTSLDGKFITLGDLLARAKPLLLLFTNPNCGPCQALLPEVGRWQLEYGPKLTIALVSEGTAAENRAKIGEDGFGQVLLQQKREVCDDYRAWGTPAAVVIRQDSVVATPVAQGADAIRLLVARSMNGGQVFQSGANGPAGTGHPAALSSTAKLGEPAPHLKLSDLNGKIVGLDAFRGRKILLLFWNSQCGFCQRMLSDLQHWDADPPRGAPSLVVLSAGTAEGGREMALHAPILIDSSGQAGRAFGANGTPMGILIDEKGRIASGVAAGADAVFELAGGRPLSQPPLMFIKP